MTTAADIGTIVVDVVPIAVSLVEAAVKLWQSQGMSLADAQAAAQQALDAMIAEDPEKALEAGDARVDAENPAKS